MSQHRRILAVIEIDGRGDFVARQAWRLAHESGAAFALAHIIDYGRGMDSDHAPFLTPQELEAKLDTLVRTRLRSLAGQIGAARASVLTAFGSAALELPELARPWQPDLIVGGSHAAAALAACADALGCDTLALPRPEPRPRPVWGWAARLLRV